MFNAFLNRALGSVGLMRIDLAAERLVPAGTTWSQILDYASGSGGIDFDQAGLPISRNTAVSYATLNRCVTLISGMVACLVTGGNLGIVDPDGRRRRGASGRQPARSVRDLLRSRDHVKPFVRRGRAGRLLPRR